MKVMDREALTCRKKLQRVDMDKEILGSLDHPFLPTLYTEFDASHYSHLIMELCLGGDLHAAQQREPGKEFSSSSAKFYGAKTLWALEYLHMIVASGVIRLNTIRFVLPCLGGDSAYSSFKSRSNFSDRPPTEMALFPQGQTIFGVPRESMQMCIYSKGNGRPTILRRDWAINLMADIVQAASKQDECTKCGAMVFAPNMTQMIDPSIALISAVQVMNLLKTLIVKTLKEQRDSVVETDSASHLKPYDENSHSPSQFCVEESEATKKKMMNNARLLPDLVLGSFHKRLFPTRYFDVFYSILSLHWLTWVTETVMRKISAAYNQGEVRLPLDLARNTESVDPRSFLLSRSNAGVFHHLSFFGFIIAAEVIKESWNAMLFAYIWVGKLETQCPGQSAWSFHQPFNGPPISIYDESGILERLSYQGKNQHRRCLHFQYLLKLRRNEKLLQSDRLENILNGSEVFKKYYPSNDEMQTPGSNVKFTIQ
ncbi:hypothetical protein NE237_024827 [Protea cynaroides]|uniref:non-specific serine/threonine protein kinase n=1 Tax=Protea cynaroides TaxID=273540 RepID=A0A9Q0H2Z8_9MAGN|nr:hypothetical protein NE237_024827 [Protea cynaroides]